MSYQYGDRVVLVNNSRNTDNAAYRRLRDGVHHVYRVEYESRHGQWVEARGYNKHGRLASHYYFFPKADVVPEKLLNKNLQDYL